MKLPYFENAYVARAKITHYLLSDTHEDGRSKAVFFVMMGFALADWETMRDAFLKHASRHHVADTLLTKRGTHYAVDGILETPSGREPIVRTVWMLEIDSTVPRFITAYPLKIKGGHP